MMNALMRPGLTTSERAVFAYLVGRANGAKVCWPSVAEIGADLGLSRKTVLNGTKVLAKHRLIQIVRRYKDSANYLIAAGLGLDDRPRYGGKSDSDPAEVQKTSPDHIENTSAATAQEPQPPPCDPVVQELPPKIDPAVQILPPAAVSGAKTVALRCKNGQSAVQELQLQSVQQESIKEGTSLRSVTRAVKRSDRGGRLADDWSVSAAGIAFAMAAGFSEAAIENMAANFADHFHAKAGQQARKVNWEATWRNWVREDVRRDPHGRRRSGQLALNSSAKGAMLHAAIGSTSLWETMSTEAPIIEPQPPPQHAISGGRVR